MKDFWIDNYWETLVTFTEQMIRLRLARKYWGTTEWEYKMRNVAKNHFDDVRLCVWDDNGENEVSFELTGIEISQLKKLI
jgi:hypothetical protein